MHPLPRVSELDLSLDRDKRATYFEQASYGVPIRMALLTSLLSSEPHALKRYTDGFRNGAAPIHEAQTASDIACANGNCIVHDLVEKPYTANKFRVVASRPPRLRCFYCETDIETFWVADAQSKAVYPSQEFSFDRSGKRNPDLRFYATLEKALLGGFSPPGNADHLAERSKLRPAGSS